jgi:hypothetical protein
LYRYLTRYAISKKEDKQAGGYLARYRGVRQSLDWKKVDDAFWKKFQAVSSGQEQAVKTLH